ncbi:MAG: PP-loop domain-containing protein [Proteobacteria bacterium]|nr:PP-loop domain-containing protein [Pseudomonadota bacterium]MBU1688097.1 PP-loop domain-containing protein [Pseudomonadota bacterium]
MAITLPDTVQLPTLSQTLTSEVNRRIGRAMHDYSMLDDGDKVMVAVSGGIDSLVLAWLLLHWQKKAPITYQVLAVHLDMGFGAIEATQVNDQLCRLGINFHTETTEFGKKALETENGRSGCYYCARQRRNRLFELAKEKDCNKLALGHHREDIIETFFINLLYGGNLSTMVPRQDLFHGKLSLIRPMAYLDKTDIIDIGSKLGVRPVKNPCPLSETSKRQEVRDLMATIYTKDPMIKSTIFSALGNVRKDYLLKPTSF